LPKKNDRFTFYLFPQKGQRPYPIAKFLLLCLVAHAENIRGSAAGAQEVSAYVIDPYFRYWLDAINPKWKMKT
jgi:hypothetical protein